MTEETVPGATVCRSCGAPIDLTMVDLGVSPLCESFLPAASLEAPETFYPLHARVCTSCWLGQIPAVVPADEIFTEYAYFSAYSESWVAHARAFVDMIVGRLELRAESFVVELASNDGYLLQHFVKRGIPVLGIDPAANVADSARERGIRTLVDFFGSALARKVVAEHGPADLVIGNNVLAQVPEVNDFVAGVAILLSTGGTATFEMPHLACLLEGMQYDTIYHEHFSYFSFASLVQLTARHGLSIVDVEELSTHGGSLRVYVKHIDSAGPPAPAVEKLLARETAEGVLDATTYEQFSKDVIESKWALLESLASLKRGGCRIAAYGAPGKGNTLLNFCGIRTDLIDYAVDRNPYKHGLFTPGTRIPIFPPSRIEETRPDVIVILPWNLVGELSAQLAYTAAWGAQLLVPVPRPTLVAPGGSVNDEPGDGS